jgi:hypothetical protein
MTKCNTNRGKSARQRNDELHQNQDHSANNQQSTPEGTTTTNKMMTGITESENTEPTQEQCRDSQ